MGREAPDPAERTGAALAVSRAHRLRRVLDHGQAVTLGHRHERVHVGGATAEMDRHDRLGAGTDGGRDGVWIDVEIVAHVREHGPCPDRRDRAGGRDEGIGRGDHLVAGADPERAHAEDEGIGAGV